MASASSDGNGGTDTAEIVVTVMPVGSIDAVDDTAETDEDTPVIISPLDNDSDPQNDPISIVQATVENGTVEILDDGTLKYTPDPDFNGDDVITYTITDDNGETDTAQVFVTVNPVGDAPDAVDDSAETD